jgi:hypothetical protein
MLFTDREICFNTLYPGQMFGDIEALKYSDRKDTAKAEVLSEVLIMQKG